MMAQAQLIEQQQDFQEDQESIGNLMEDQSVTENELEDEDEDIPEKYKGKSLKELVEMHQNAEKLVGKQSGEVGELRKIVDDFIRSQVTQKTPQEHDDTEEDVDFFVDPQAAVAKAIERHPAVQKANEYTVQAKKAATQAQLNQKHPDALDIIANPKFGEWVTSSRIRTELFKAADNYDFEAADELLSLWKERQSFAQQAVQTDKQARKSTVKQAATGTARASSEPMARKKYRRADIIRLMQDDPKRYEQLQPEIMQAYAEGRVV